ncbi:hypothetical protein CONPUDRAFT_136352 [Coniophora puteana RWD-64-598 SS2]|uniref:Uncharacterized protein n=1 Tax=Coniophora puteana (strain RWD-64-598) TaxID=741705 RepID=A0A5M3MVT1_CONPW|nr:uncharacterized protein CONPUDRAFT_136352 [Coniophora puteana RWD-64-598 SS2]EIW83259.1 hypothetical protein CONPUDRAFT_136352 [Coniophora puteana RWD-64-598 SS2]
MERQWERAKHAWKSTAGFPFFFTDEWWRERERRMQRIEKRRKLRKRSCVRGANLKREETYASDMEPKYHWRDDSGTLVDEEEMKEKNE